LGRFRNEFATLMEPVGQLASRFKTLPHNCLRLSKGRVRHFATVQD
jgi:hypothetical protein